MSSSSALFDPSKYIDRPRTHIGKTGIVHQGGAKHEPAAIVDYSVRNSSGGLIKNHQPGKRTRVEQTLYGCEPAPSKPASPQPVSELATTPNVVGSGANAHAHIWQVDEFMIRPTIVLEKKLTRVFGTDCPISEDPTLDAKSLTMDIIRLAMLDIHNPKHKHYVPWAQNEVIGFVSLSDVPHDEKDKDKNGRYTIHVNHSTLTENSNECVTDAKDNLAAADAKWYAVGAAADEVLRRPEHKITPIKPPPYDFVHHPASNVSPWGFGRMVHLALMASPPAART